MMGTATPVLQRGAVERPEVLPEVPLQQLLEELYRTQRACDPEDRYLLEHGQRVCIENQIRTFHWYRPFLPAAGKILDWGCYHAPDSCLLRAWFADGLSLYGCDFKEQGRHQVFQDFARASYTKLEDEVQLPFPENFFDAVIGSGVLEHTALDYESLKELRRVLKPEGMLVISYLPNWLSLKEWLRRVVQKRDFHHRLYGFGEMRQLLKRSGFLPVASRYQMFLWERLLAASGLRRWQAGGTKLLARLCPVQVFSSALCFVARKVMAL